MNARPLGRGEGPALSTLTLAGEEEEAAASISAPASSAPAEGLAPVLLRRARPADVPGIHTLISEYAAQGLVLPRTPERLAREIDTFTVAVDGHGVVGCGSLRIYTPTLAEVCALAVADRCQGRGLGGALVESIAEEAARFGITQLFALTLREKFFNRLGFRTGVVTDVPEKVWADCDGCPFRTACREIMVVRDL